MYKRNAQKNVKVYTSMDKASMDEDQMMGKVSIDE